MGCLVMSGGNNPILQKREWAESILILSLRDPEGGGDTGGWKIKALKALHTS